MDVVYRLLSVFDTTVKHYTRHPVNIKFSLLGVSSTSILPQI